MNSIVIQIAGEVNGGQFVATPTRCEFALDCDSFSIGSQPDTTPHVRIDNPTVSRKHLNVESLENDHWSIRDAGSDNGTIVIDSPADSLEDVFAADDWSDACRRITDLVLSAPAWLILGEVVVRLVPVADETKIADKDLANTQA